MAQKQQNCVLFELERWVNILCVLHQPLYNLPKLQSHKTWYMLAVAHQPDVPVAGT